MLVPNGVDNYSAKGFRQDVQQRPRYSNPAKHGIIEINVSITISDACEDAEESGVSVKNEWVKCPSF